MLRAAPLLLLASAASACPWHACVDDDAAWEPLDVFDVVTGQVPEHGELAIEIAEIRAEAALRWNLLDVRARMELAWARLRLGRTEEALRAVASGSSLAPGRYEWLTLESAALESRGEFAAAAEALGAALAASPDACPRLGDLHWRALRWQAAPGPRDFLGVRYGDWPSASSRADFRSLCHLAARFPRFADAFLVLGDELCRLGAANLAVWAWARARLLGHPARGEIDRRLGTTFVLWRVGPGRSAQAVEEALRAIEARLVVAEKWKDSYRRAEFLAVLSGDEASFPSVEAALARRGVRRAAGEDVEAVPVGPGDRARAARALSVPGPRAAAPARSGWRLDSVAVRALAAATALIVLAGLVALARRFNLRVRPRVLAAAA